MVYPISNRQTTLTVDYFDIRRQVGAYLGIGYSDKEWDDEQNETVNDIIREGLQNYYFPPMLVEPYASAVQEVHEWSFLRPTWTFDTEGGERRYPLPSDFERPIGNLTYPDSDNTFYSPIKFTSASRLRSLEYQTNFTSYPQFSAIEPGESQGDDPQELVLVLHPTPDAAYSLSLQYQAHPKTINADHPFPLGGQMHGPGIMASCLAVAEVRQDGIEGIMNKKFMEVLASNIVRDRQRGAILMGYNGNGSANVSGRGTVRYFNGLFYDNVTYAGGSFPGN